MLPLGPKRLLSNRVLPLKKWKNEKRKTLPIIARPPEERFWVACESLEDYLDLPPEVIKEIWNWQLSRLNARSKALNLIPNRDKHQDTEYILKGILFCKQGGFAMSGASSTPRGERFRYYKVTRSRTSPHDGCVYNKSVRAEPIEDAVLKILEEVLASPECFRSDIGKHVRRRIAEQENDKVGLASLKDRQQQIKSKLEMFFDTFGVSSQQLLKEKVNGLEDQLKILNERIDAVQESCLSGENDVDGIVESVVQQLAQIGRTIRKQPLGSIRRVLKTLISKLVVDLNTHEVEVEVALPALVLSKENRIANPVRLELQIDPQSKYEANSDSSLRLAVFVCSYRPKYRNCHFTYRRVDPRRAG